LRPISGNAFIAYLVMHCQIALDGIGVLVCGIPMRVDCLGLLFRIGTGIMPGVLFRVTCQWR
jgi:hypothetical protein